MTCHEASLVLYNCLTWEIEAELEHVPSEKINTNDGIDYILDP